MLISFRKGTLALAAAMTLTAGSATANEHIVLIVDGSYFPEITYANVGDTIIFENESEASHTVTSTDGAWTSGAIAVEGSFSMELEENTVLTYAGLDSEGLEVLGEFSYDAPPVGD